MVSLGIHLGSVAVLALFVELACRFGKFRPTLCHALWLVVLLKLMAPPVLGWPVDAALFGSITWDHSPARAQHAAAERQSLARGELADEREMSAGQATGDSISVGAVPRAGSKPWTAVFGLIWCAGGLAATARMAREVRRARRRVIGATTLPSWLQLGLEEASRALGMAAPPAVLTGEPGAVYVQITGRPVLVVSADALEHVAPEQWPAILTHELAHLKRRDHWVAWLLLVAGVVWWWNPVYWWARRRIHLFSEMACDAWVVETHPDGRRQYAEAMVRVMAMLSGQSSPSPAMGLSVWSAATQERRLWMIMKSKGACRLSGRGMAGLAVLALAVAPAWMVAGAEKGENAHAAPGESGTAAANTGRSGEAAAAAPAAGGWTLSLEPAEAIQEKLKTVVSVEFENIHLKDVVEYIQDSYDVNIVLDDRAVAPEPRQSVGIPVSFSSGQGGGSGDSLPRFSVGEPPQPIDAPPEEAPDSPLGGEAYASDGMIPSFKLVDVPLLETLKALARPLSLAVQVRGDCIWMSTNEFIAADQAIPLPAAAPDAGDVQKRMKSHVNVEFEDIHIADMIDFISKSFKLNVVVDPRVVMPEGGDWNAPSADSPGYATDGVLSYVNLKDVALGEFLYVATRQLNLSYRLENNQVVISTPEIIASGEAVPAP